MDCDYTVHSAVAREMASLSRREQERLLTIFSRLADNPFLRGDREQRDAIGQRLEVRRFGRWMAVYWADHPVKEVRIIDVERVTA